MEDLTGKQLGPYQVTAPLGEGGMAAVYKAYQPAMDRYVALKILPRHFASDPNFVARFQQEAKVLAKLQHPHILPVFDFGEADGYTYIVMPFVPSGTLAARLGHGPLALDQVTNIVSQLGDALDYAHSRGLIHRDIKPSNVLIDERGNCLLTDFGLAKILEGSTKLTTTGGIMGTPAYMSPEQGLGLKLDRHTDIYSLGVILYEMATGRPPYAAETPMAIVVKHINDPLPPPRTIQPDLPEALERVILKALAKNALDRFDTAGEMVKALQRAQAETLLKTSAPAPATVAAPAPATVAAPARTLPAATQPGIPAAPETAVPTKVSRPLPLWQLALRSAAGWILGIILSLPFLGRAPAFGGLIVGPVGGASLGLAWRRMDAAQPRRRVVWLAVIWGVICFLVGAGAQAGPLPLIFMALGGFVAGFYFRRAEPRLSWKQVGLIGLGWLGGLLVGGLIFAGATSAGQLVGLIGAIIGVTLAFSIGSGLTFWQVQRAQARPALAPKAQPRRRWAWWMWILGGLGLLAVLFVLAAIAGNADDRRAATQTAGAAPAAAQTAAALQQRLSTFAAGPSYLARIRLTTTSDWTNLRIVLGGLMQRGELLAVSPEGSFTQGSGQLSLSQAPDRAESGGTVEAIVNIPLYNLRSGQTIKFEIERGNLGMTEVEVYTLADPNRPVTLGTFVWKDTIATPGLRNTYYFEVPSDDLMAGAAP